MTTNPPRMVLIAGWIEGTTFLLLLGLAVPLKRLFDEPALVTYLGPVHGVAFLVYSWTLIQAFSDGLIGGRAAALGFVVAMAPFGTFVFWRRSGNSQKSKRAHNK